MLPIQLPKRPPRSLCKRDETEGDYMAAVSGVRCAQGIARPFCPLRSTLTPDTAAKALACRFNRAPRVAARPDRAKTHVKFDPQNTRASNQPFELELLVHS